jgi:hypothetical protein
MQRIILYFFRATKPDFSVISSILFTAAMYDFDSVDANARQRGIKHQALAASDIIALVRRYMQVR